MPKQAYTDLQLAERRLVRARRTQVNYEWLNAKDRYLNVIEPSDSARLHKMVSEGTHPDVAIHTILSEPLDIGAQIKKALE